ncbi:MAG: FAD:protein FMN transferase [Clostridia bacterium]|nr:FAD:protein FMN transferase [Clostridia bacterium]
MKKLICLFLSAVLLCSCGSSRESVQGFALDTVITITADKKHNTIARKALLMCSDYEKIFSKTKEEGELSKLNDGKLVPEGELLEVLDFALDIASLSGGAFDPTVKPLTDLWDIKSRSVPPSEEEIKLALKSVGYKSVSMYPFNAMGRQFDLGGIAKGYIADKMCEYMKSEGAEDFIIDLGGNVIVNGKYTVGIRNPFSPDEIYAAFELENKSAVTSGAYQRYFEYNGVRYHHIIDPRTGKCAESKVASVTVISPSSMQADALSTALFVLGEEGLSLLEEFSDTDWFIVKEDGTAIYSKDFCHKYKVQSDYIEN